METDQIKELVQSMSESTFGVIGMGNIGKATISGFIRNNLFSKTQLWICNKTAHETEEKCNDAFDLSNISVAKNNHELVRNCNVIFIALKQNQMREELTSWHETKILDPNKLIISFAAGVHINTIKKWVGYSNQPVIRIMPNTPIAVGKGVFGWTVSDEVTIGQTKIVQYLLRSLGTECLVGSDEAIDIITAISGSGPAYFYLFAEHMIRQAANLGIKEEDAERLVRQTFIGAAALLDQQSNFSISELRKRITSKGGTTEKAIQSFNEDNLFLLIQRAMQGAKQKATELGY
jgi:pyrroline-5-carboxylate reductase